MLRWGKSTATPDAFNKSVKRVVSFASSRLWARVHTWKMHRRSCVDSILSYTLTENIFCINALCRAENPTYKKKYLCRSRLVTTGRSAQPNQKRKYQLRSQRSKILKTTSSLKSWTFHCRGSADRKPCTLGFILATPISSQSYQTYSRVCTCAVSIKFPSSFCSGSVPCSQS